MLFFHFWPVSSSSQCWLSQLTHQILHNNIGRTRRQQSVPTILTQTVGRRRFEGRASRLERRESRVARGLKGLEKQAIIWSTIFFNRTGGTFLGNYLGPFCTQAGRNWRQGDRKWSTSAGAGCTTFTILSSCSKGPSHHALGYNGWGLEFLFRSAFH